MEFNEYNYYSSPFISSRKRRRRYGPMRFIFDCIMTVLTSGLWLIWVFVREMRRH